MDALKFDRDGLIPVVVQDDLTGEIRMVAYASSEAVATTLKTGRATFFSRSRGQLWEKGQTSGIVIAVHRVLVDCDADCVIYSAAPQGPTCHTGAPSCFFRVLGADARVESAASAQTLLSGLEAELEARKQSTGKVSYTKSLYEKGALAIAAKVEEEAAEFGRALASETDARVASEAADVVYHLLVGLRWRSIPWSNVLRVLAKRFGTSGHAEKASRATDKSAPG